MFGGQTYKKMPVKKITCIGPKLCDFFGIDGVGACYVLLFNCSLQSDYLWEMELKINQMIGCGILKTMSNEAWMYHWIHNKNDIDVSFMVSSERLIMIWWQFDFVLTIWGFDTALWWFLNLNLHSDLCWYNICKTLYIWFLWQNTNRLNYFLDFTKKWKKIE